jgi:glutamate/tyrosine decarboxylase-like PLP-dependent enzyme
LNLAEQLKRLEAWDRFFADDAAPPCLQDKKEKPVGEPSAWFLGPKAENQRIFTRLITEAIEQHCKYRREFHPEDPEVIDEGVKWSPDYQAGIARLEQKAHELFECLRKSAPIFSMRHHGHMLWDQALPAMVGYFAAMLYNQNNVAAEVSPITTQLEIRVGNDLCRMLGFDVPARDAADGTIRPWGHITCDGSVANIEALWAARNAKFFAVAIREALRSELKAADKLEVTRLDGSAARLTDLKTWELLNLPIDEVVALPYRIRDQFGLELKLIHKAIRAYAVQSIGLVAFQRRFLREVPNEPAVLVPSTRHYSWDKAGTLLGLGQNSILKVPVDLDAHMSLEALEQRLNECLAEERPVLAVVAVIGTTQEGAVDDLVRILDCRARFQKRGLDFAIHCDAAWGGYFRSMGRSASAAQEDFAAPSFPLSSHVSSQLAALGKSDSITVDPHKAGYVPYPAGALCYRNSGLRDLISLGAPVIFHDQSEPTVGIYGIEGSKPGAAAAAVHLAHQVISPTREGYGKILGQCVWTSNRLYCRLRTLGTDDGGRPARRFKITLLQRSPAERAGNNPKDVETELKQISRFARLSDQGLKDLFVSEPEAYELFRSLGSDLVILAYSFNFWDQKTNGWNQSVEKHNRLNDEIFKICSTAIPKTDTHTPELILTGSAFDAENYGTAFVTAYCERVGINNTGGADVSFLISTTMNPWATDIKAGPHGQTTSFIDIFADALKGAVEQALTKLGF